MNRPNKHARIIALLLAVLLVFSLGATAFAEDAAPLAAGDVQIVVYHTNDMHGALTFTQEGCIGLARVAALKQQTPGSILVDAGDATQGLPLASLTQGADVIDLMNAAGYDAMAAGNHEFDYGPDVLLQNARRAAFPMLAANVIKDGDLLLDLGGEKNGRHTIVERNGKKIGFFGLTTADTATATNPAVVAGLTFEDEVATAQREIDALTARGADAIIALAHLGEYTSIPCHSAQLANAMTGAYQGKLTAIIDGHSHTIEEKTVNGVLIAQTGTGLTKLGKVTLTIGDAGVAATGALLSYDDMKRVTPDPVVEQKINEINAAQGILLDQRVCETANTLWGGTINGIAEARVGETNLGDFAADAMRAAALSFQETNPAYAGMDVIAVENGGGLRSSLPNGMLKKRDFVGCFPFSNTLMLKVITPKILYEMLEVSVGNLTGQNSETGMLEGQPNGGFLQVSGLSFSYDPSAPKGAKVTAVSLGNARSLLDKNDSTTQLLLAANSFLMAGGSNYSMLAPLPLAGEMGGELEVLEHYALAQTNGGSTPLLVGAAAGRIRTAGAYTPKPYTAFVRVQNANGSAAANLPVSVYVDGGAPLSLQTDASGLLAIPLADGPHGVSLSAGQSQVYVNNYSGVGLLEDSIRTFPVLAYQEPLPQPTPTARPTAQPTERPAVQPTPQPVSPPAAQPSPAPKTGDSEALPAYILLCALAVLLIFAARKNHTGKQNP